MARSNGGITGVSNQSSFGKCKVTKFTSSGTLTTQCSTRSITSVVVAGGGGSGSDYGGGGGAGGLRLLESLAVSGNNNVAVVIGGGGAGSGTSPAEGEDSGDDSYILVGVVT